MKRTTPLSLSASRTHRVNFPPIVKITNGTFYTRHPSSRPRPGQEPSKSSVNSSPNPPLFQNLTLSLPSFSTPNEHWAILSPSSTIRTAFLHVLRGQLLCFPPTARSYPYLSTPNASFKSRTPDRALAYVGFDVERRAFGGAYLSARYESHREAGDVSLARYLSGVTGLNEGEEFVRARLPPEEVLARVVKDLELERFVQKPVSTLSNGQSRRARIGKALLSAPEMLLLDAPFIGLDPFVSKHISQVLHRLAESNAPRVVLSLRPQDVVPDWITHIVYAGEDGKVDTLGPKAEVFRYLKNKYETAEQRGAKGVSLDPKLVELREVGRHLSERGDFEAGKESGATGLSRDGYEKNDETRVPLGDPLVEMQGVRIKYGSNSVLGDWQQDVDGTKKDGLWWDVRRGQRWGIFGANGSGKTTLLSLITSDHPQTYSAPVRIFQRSRLPSPGIPGISIFDIQSRMGHSSPEVHALFPKQLSLRRTLESAWADTPLTRPALNAEAGSRIDACLRWFEVDLNPQLAETASSNLEWSSSTLFGQVSYSAQRVLLFLRAVIRHPDILILDEAFSGMDDLVRDKCLLFLTRGEGMTLTYTDKGSVPVPSAKAKSNEVVVEGLQDHQAMLCVSHSRQEVPGCVREWVCLPESGTGQPRFGRFSGPVESSYRRWEEIWKRS
ncbi:P-loop containing nucleoside triphosphate hydrolase protein [Mytilinidion resinicola]|uniref:P-loop containing nucleoside triphosphate hydrolase protein n=1 Tax=Mytilinidion resinicola TaxID=574789 RepID=A0A6A6YIE1_9PEZI|nr:P-loop containing nucleoside triphosphate hydrolase protein [Mytilinidion resinicola]KAF2808293.1 P-loop containing nucleoside triphosphate hydrolase protein [Mytilinidion resinicola]